MLPKEIELRLKHVGLIEQSLINFFNRAGLEITQNKTIATQILYHQKTITGVNVVEFFSGQLDEQNTNINSSFVRPSSEHFLIYGIRCLVSENPLPITNPVNEDYSYGVLENPAINDFALLNGELSLETNSLTVLKNLPMTEFDAANTSKNVGFLMLNEPVLWQGQTELKMSLRSKKGFTFGSVSPQAVRFELHGIGLI